MTVRSVSALAFAATLLTSVAALAAPTTYATRAAFDAAVPVQALETFENCSGGPSYNAGEVFSAANLPSNCTALTAGISYTGALATDNLYSATPGQSSNPTQALGLDLAIGSGISFVLAAPTTGFAADLFQNFGGGSQGTAPVTFNVELFSGLTSIALLNTSVAPNGGSFFGVTELGGFDRVVITLPAGYTVADNVAWGAASTSVSEPTTLMLTGAGLLGLAALRRRRKA
jgi:hypothetical protein